MSSLPWPHRLAVIAGLLALTIRAGATPQVVATGGAPPGPRTGMIVGQVVDGSTGTPIPEAIVQITMPKYLENLPTTPKGRVMADGEGRFFFTDLPAGDYYLQTTKEGYVAGVYGQRLASSQYQLLSVSEGERRADIKLQLWKYAVVGGTVVDEAGEPVVGISVRALAKDVIAGRAQYGTVSYLVPTTITDDRGVFRLSRMAPGTYVIVAPSTQATVPANYVEATDPWVRTELFSAGVAEVALLGQPRAQQVGDSALVTSSSVLVPPPASSSGRMGVYRTTYFPSATTAAAATPITLESGTERTDLAITLRPVPAVRVSGRLLTPDGSPAPPMTLRLVGEAMRDVAMRSLPSSAAEVGLETGTAISDGSGRFTFLGVPPGDYVLGHANKSLATAAQQGRSPYWVSQRLVVGATDVPDLAVELRLGLRISGRLEFRASNGATSATPMPNILLVTFEPTSGEPDQFVVEAGRGATSFTTTGPGGRYFIRGTELGGWFVQSITLDGKDVTDKPVELQADTTSIVVTYTDRPTKVSGSVRDLRGAVSTIAAVLAFPADPQRWVDNGATPRDLKKAAAARDGGYSFAHLPPGDYNLIAVDEADSDGWKDPKRLEILASQATKLKIAAGDSAKTIDLTLKAIR